MREREGLTEGFWGIQASIITCNIFTGSILEQCASWNMPPMENTVVLPLCHNICVPFVCFASNFICHSSKNKPNHTKNYVS